MRPFHDRRVRSPSMWVPWPRNSEPKKFPHALEKDCEEFERQAPCLYRFHHSPAQPHRYELVGGAVGRSSAWLATYRSAHHRSPKEIPTSVAVGLPHERTLLV